MASQREVGLVVWPTEMLGSRVIGRPDNSIRGGPALLLTLSLGETPGWAA